MRRSGWIRLGGPVIVFLSFGVLGGCVRGASGPVAAIPALFTLSDAEEGRIGLQAEQAVLAEANELDVPVLQGYIDRVGLELASGTERKGVRWRFHVIDDPEPNAFALPGGAIFLNRGVLLAMRDGSELAGVLGHEVAHIGLRHGVEALQRQMILEGLASLALSDQPEALQRVGAIALGLARNGLTREDERAADREGLRLVSLTGFSSDGLARFLDTLRVKVGDTHPAFEILSDHPPLSQRIADLTQLRTEIRGAGDLRDASAYQQAIQVLR